MAKYFVNAVSGSDANSGRSAASPWRHGPWSKDATGRAAAAVLVEGDEVLISAQTSRKPNRRWKDLNDGVEKQA